MLLFIIVASRAVNLAFCPSFSSILAYFPIIFASMFTFSSTNSCENTFAQVTTCHITVFVPKMEVKLFTKTRIFCKVLTSAKIPDQQSTAKPEQRRANGRDFYHAVTPNYLLFFYFWHTFTFIFLNLDPFDPYLTLLGPNQYSMFKNIPLYFLNIYHWDSCMKR